MEMPLEVTFVSVILPLRFRGEVVYRVPDRLSESVQTGSRVKVEFGRKIYPAVVEKVFRQAAEGPLTGAALSRDNPESKEKPVQIKEILAVEDLPPAGMNEIRLWNRMAEYYMCTPGEIFKAAYPDRIIRQETVKARKTVGDFFEAIARQDLCREWGLYPQDSPATNQTAAGEPASGSVPVLSDEQQKVFGRIGQSFGSDDKPVLLQGVTGSGKTEIYIRLAMEQLCKGRNALYLVPEIAVGKQLQQRLKKVFGERLLVFHSQQTPAEKTRIRKILSGQKDETQPVNDAVIVLGTRSALLLPYKKLGLIIVDEEHDASYKQTEPSPRYHARDAAILLAGLWKAHIVLGSATPSFESEYNCAIGRFRKIRLEGKFYGAQDPEVVIIDTLQARKTRQMKGDFSQKLINELKAEIARGGQALVFRNRRSYSPVVECTECGNIPKCPHCNVYLSYHKYNGTLRCHYCEYTAPYSGICPACGLDTLRYKGAGTEKLEEELRELLPGCRIARFDADIAKSKRAQEQVLKDFARGETDILVGTQMISKGFDFSRLNLVAVVQADTILGIQDFRADERAFQLFTQLMGRTGRRGQRGKLIIQTNQKEHPVFARLRQLSDRSGPISGNRPSPAPGTDSETAPGSAPEPADYSADSLLKERKEFRFPPFVRMVKIIVRHRNPEKLDAICRQLSAGLATLPCREFTGPFTPPVDRVRGEWIKWFYVKYSRDARLARNKARLLQLLESFSGSAVVPDVDPV